VCKGRHAAQTVTNAQIPLNRDPSQGGGDRPNSQELAQVLKVSKRKIDRLKRRFVQNGLELALSNQPSQLEYRQQGGRGRSDPFDCADLLKLTAG
jgi:hypothetical protein